MDRFVPDQEVGHLFHADDQEAGHPFHADDQEVERGITSYFLYISNLEIF